MLRARLPDEVVREGGVAAVFVSRMGRLERVAVNHAGASNERQMDFACVARVAYSARNEIAYAQRREAERARAVLDRIKVV